jgi:hypothetical protein
MKHITYSLVAAIILFVAACKKDTNSTVPLTGKWKLLASYISPGGPGVWTNVPAGDNRYIYFYGNGKLQSNMFWEFTKYSIKDSTTLIFTKIDNTIENYSYRIRHDSLTMSPAGPIFCIEGCATKFIKASW